MAEKFNYANVSSAMDNVMSEKDAGIQNLNKGTEEFGAYLTAGSGQVAIAGVSAETMKAQWDDLTTRFAAFAKYIEEIDTLVKNAGTNDANLESEISAASQKANQQ